jgi:hypothetical protein
MLRKQAELQAETTHCHGMTRHWREMAWAIWASPGGEKRGCCPRQYLRKILKGVSPLASVLNSENQGWIIEILYKLYLHLISVALSKSQQSCVPDTTNASHNSTCIYSTYDVHQRHDQVSLPVQIPQPTNSSSPAISGY